MRWLVVSAVLSAFVLAVVGCGGSKTASDQETTGAVATETAAEDSTVTDAEEESPDTETTAETDTDTETAGLLGKCKELAEATSAYQAALGGTGDTPVDLADSAKALSAMADAAPEEIRSSFRILAKAVTAYAELLDGVDLTSGKAPDPETLAKVLAATQSLGTAEFAAAAQEIADWTTKNCAP